MDDPDRVLRAVLREARDPAELARALERLAAVLDEFADAEPTAAALPPGGTAARAGAQRRVGLAGRRRRIG